MSWTVLFHDEFDREFQILAKGLQDELLADARFDMHLASLAAAVARKGKRHAKKS